MRLEERILTTKDGERLKFYFSEKGHRRWILMVHGVGEHAGRHQFLASLFSQYANVALIDLRGHGKSSGERANVSDFRLFAQDIGQWILLLGQQFKMEQYLIYGHSMGGLIVTDFLQRRSVIAQVLNTSIEPPVAAFLSAPAVKPAGLLGSWAMSLPRSLLRRLANLPVSIRVAGLVDIYYLSHNLTVFEEYLRDPLTNTRLHTHLLLQLLSHSQQVFQQSLQGLGYPVHCYMGEKDRMISAAAVKNYFSNQGPDVFYHQVPEGYHELHNEIDRIRHQYIEVLQQTLIPFLN